MHSNTPLHSVEELDAVKCSTTCSKRENARLSSSEDFATGKCRSIDRLAEKGFLHQKLKQTKFAKQETGFSYPLILSHLKTIRFKKQQKRGPYTQIFSQRIQDVVFFTQIESSKLDFIHKIATNFTLKLNEIKMLLMGETI